MKKHPIWLLIIAIAVLVIPTTIYLCILVPKLSEEYNILMSSGGVIGGAGLYGASKIPDKVKYGGMFKTAANSFTILTVTILVEEFIVSLVGLVAVFVVCFIIFKILMEGWKGARRRKENSELAREIARNLNEASK